MTSDPQSMSHATRLFARRRNLAVVLALVAVAAVACGGAAGDGESSRVRPDLSQLTVQTADLPESFTQPEPIDGFPLPEAIDFAVDAKFFIGSQDREAGLAMEFLVSGVATIAIASAVDDFFADPDAFIRATLADIGRDLETVRVVPLDNLGDDAVGVVYFPGGVGRQDIVIFRRGNLLGYVGLFKPTDYSGMIDVGRTAAVMDQRFASALLAPGVAPDP